MGSRVVARRLGAGSIALAVGLAVASGAWGQSDPQPRYGETPEEILPFKGAGEPYALFFTEAPTFRGPGRELAEPPGLDSVKLGALLPEKGVDRPLGESFRNGVGLAVSEANAAGGFDDRLPFEVLFRDEAAAWGAAANAAVELTFDHGVWGIVGAVEDNASHVMSRVLLKVEVPVVNTSGTDPTLTEHMVPWMIRMRPDDRRNGYRLAQKIFAEDGRRRVAVFRANSRYARMGVREFVDSARRLHHPILLEVRFEPGDVEFDLQIERLRAVEPDAILVWGRPEVAGRVVAAIREAGLEQAIYGPDRLFDPSFFGEAGRWADGVVVTRPFIPETAGPRWREFEAVYREAFGSGPDEVAAYAYDGTVYLIEAIRAAGLNRVRIRERLFEPETFEGVTGSIRFDRTQNNVSQVEVCTLQGGRCREAG
jgi:branched-chain amino acid transport system substrate-binding protein